jgi:hypothetical protein
MLVMERQSCYWDGTIMSKKGKIKQCQSELQELQWKEPGKEGDYEKLERRE